MRPAATAFGLNQGLAARNPNHAAAEGTVSRTPGEDPALLPTSMIDAMVARNLIGQWRTRPRQ